MLLCSCTCMHIFECVENSSYSMLIFLDFAWRVCVCYFSSLWEWPAIFILCWLFICKYNFMIRCQGQFSILVLFCFQAYDDLVIALIFLLSCFAQIFSQLSFTSWLFWKVSAADTPVVCLLEPNYCLVLEPKILKSENWCNFRLSDFSLGLDENIFSVLPFECERTYNLIVCPWTAILLCKYIGSNVLQIITNFWFCFCYVTRQNFIATVWKLSVQVTQIS